MLKNCAQCSKEINIKKAKLKPNNFCSKACFDAFRKDKPRNYQFTEEHKTNISKSASRRTYTEEGRKKISDRMKKAFVAGDYTSPMKGKSHSSKTKQKLKVANTGKPSAFKGRKHSKASLAKISKACQAAMTEERKQQCAEWGLKGRLTSAKTKEPSSIEKLLYDYLEQLEINFDKQFSLGKGFLADAFIKELKLVIEADGSYWHSTPRGVATDKRKDQHINEIGLLILRIPESLFRTGEYKEVLDKKFRGTIKNELNNIQPTIQKQS